VVLALDHKWLCEAYTYGWGTQPGRSQKYLWTRANGKKKKFVGPNKLNFYFYLIFFNFLEKKKFLPNKFVF